MNVRTRGARAVDAIVRGTQSAFYFISATLFVLALCSIPVGTVYVVCHFLRKYW